uniref:Large ribosomal subunit protein bL32c n=24 Tax=Mesangiospermae TaxID=1437183 RepID=A0A0U1XDF6_EUSLA|nr:ribosomal protein L32 [Eustrephus latifolius]AIR12557.1 ribosomal protein L32 [Eustrephus latifolius]
MAVPKKRTSISKKRIRKNIWKKKGYLAAIKAFSLAKSICTGNSNFFFSGKKITGDSKGFGRQTSKKITGTEDSKSFFVQQTTKKILE